TEHLLQQGARNIAFVGGLEGRAVTQLRMSGYLTTLAANGLQPLHLPGRPGRSFGREVARRLAQEHPTVDAVLCFNDLTALGLLTGCAEQGRAIGQSLKIVGFDDIEDCAQVYPALSSVRCDIAGFGRRMAETVLEWLESDHRPLPETVTPVTLIPRASSKG
ncbi:MAG: LacI family transcriptional regulator, partial [Acetobacteraceae bacterium]